MKYLAKKASISERHHALDLVRGLAALAVANYHFLAWNAGVTIQSMGTFSVYTFFILSALTMLMVYGDEFQNGVTPDRCSNFFRNRVARLLPLLCCVSAVAIAAKDFHVAAIGKAILTGSGLFALATPGSLEASPGTWSLGIETLFYLLFPVLAMGAMRTSKKTLWVCVLLLLLAQHILLALLRPTFDDFSVFWGYYSVPLMFSPFFAIGFLIWRMGGERSVWLVPIALLTLASLFLFSLVSKGNLFTDQVSYLALTFIAGLAVYLFHRSELPSWLVPVATFIGDISYSIYLTHWIVNPIARKITEVMKWNLAIHWILFDIIAITLAYISYRWLETTARRWIRSRTSVPALQMDRTDLP